MGLAEEARRAAQRITEEEYVRVLARRDTDGLAAAALLAVALDREGVDFHATFAHDVRDDDVRGLEEERPAVLLAVGLGAERVPDLAKSGAFLVVVDWADPEDATPPEAAMLTPHAASHAGEPSVASLALVLARTLAKRNSDLAGLALAGARATAGPAASLRGLDAEVLAEEVAERRVLRGPALAWPEPVLEALSSGIEPFVPAFAGRARVAKRFLDELGVDATLPARDLDPAARARLADALVRRALASGAGASLCDAVLEPDLRPVHGPTADLPVRETAAMLAAAADAEPADALAYALARTSAPTAREDAARALHGLLTATRVGEARLPGAEAPSPALLGETVRRLQAIDAGRPAVAWALQDGRAHVRAAGVPGERVASAAAAVGGHGGGSATRGRAVVAAEALDALLAVLGAEPA